MSEILCRWINSDLKLSKSVDPKTISADFANGYLIGEMLHKYQLQDDFDQFSKGRTANTKLNNYSRIEPTLQLLGVPFDAGFAQALMQEVPGAATRLLYQLYVLLEKKRRAGLTGAIMETMQPAATARLHRMEREVYNERLRTVVKREADKQLQKISQRYEFRGHEMLRRSTRAQREKQQEMQKVDRDMHLKEIEERRLARRKQQEIMVQLQNTAAQTPTAPTKQSLRPPERQWRQNRKQKEAQDVRREIARFERNLKKQLPVESLSSSVPYGFPSEGLWPEEVALTSSEYVLKIRQRLERDAAAREQREKRRRQALVKQLQAHEEQQEAIRDAQLVARLTRHTKQERRVVVQLMQIHQQKEVLRQNRIFREKQYQEQRLRGFQEALDQEAALAQQARLDHADELCREKEMHDRIAAERVQARRKKHFDACQDVLGQMVDLATRVGEFRLLTGNRIPAKLIREWKELFFHAMPLYEGGAVETPASEPTQEQARETEQLEILNNQDYDEYTSMMGEWVWPGEGGGKEPPPNNCILAHVVTRLKAIVESPMSASPPSFVLGFTLKACVLGKPFAGKTTCLARINQTHGIHILSVGILVQEALEAFRTGEVVLGTVLEELETFVGCALGVKHPDTFSSQYQPPESRVSSSEDCEEVEQDHGKGQDVSGSIESDLLSHHFQQHPTQKKEPKPKLSVRAQQGGAAEKILRKGKAVPDELLVEIIVEAIRRVPSESGWILDGFPVHLNQAKLLEKALCGFNPDDGSKKQRNREPNLAVDPNALKETPPPPPVLDVVLLLDVPDDVVLDRAAKQALEQGGSGPAEEESGTEADPAAEEEASVKPQRSEKAAPLKPKGLGMSQVQHRVTAFHGNWPKLEKWYSRRQDILVRVNAEEEPDVVFRKVESILYQTMLQQADGGRQAEAATAASAPEHPYDRGTGTTELPANPPADVAYVDEPLPKEIPEYLAPHWQNVCTSYVTNIKTVMQNVRAQRSLIIQHLYNIREEFIQYLKRPDLKQEFVVQWQQEYNSIPQDMRFDGDTKAEIHLRLDELRERLWDICDQRREEARREQAAIEGDSWIDDHTAMLINHFAALMQVELDRFQDTILLLRDYYSGMLGQIHPETVMQFSHVPMLDVIEDKGDVQTEKDGEEKRTQIIPLISRSPSSIEADVKQKGSMDGHPSEKLLDSIWQTALTAVNSLVAIEVQSRKAVENEETQQRMEQEHLQRESQASVTSHNIKEKKKGSRKKDVQSPVQEPSPCPPMEENEEEMRRRAVRAQIHQEHAMAVDVEDCRARARLELIQARALSMVRDLQLQAQQTYQAMQDQLSGRFLAEMTSIDKLVELVGKHIESGSQIKYQLVLEGLDFFMDGEKRVVDPPAPPPRPPPWELPQDSTLTILQLRELHTQFYKVAPSGQLCAVEFSEILRWLVSLHMGSDALPRLWKCLSEAQILNLVSVMSQDSELLDWRRFLLSAAMPWPLPTQAQLLEVLAQFRAADPQNTGFVTEESYLQTELWFPSERKSPPPDDPSEPLPYDRLANLKKFFFALFADHTPSPPRLDYGTVLLYFAMHPDCEQGWVRALSVVTGQPLRYRPRRAPLLKSVPYIEEASDSAHPEGEPEPASSEEGGTVTIPALLKVACHGGPRSSTHNRFCTSWKKREEYEEGFRNVYEELGFGAEDEVPFSLLSQHPTLQELMESSVQYQLPDMHCVLQAQLGENESHSQFPLS
ncbi:sperm flagellar protein 2 isoform X2 [Brienomyrus brachyistius]|uniref:sperm flagellar protein 2 isoform X2 n=1 Tax=Brienomyrus brachyistius TaxID=42636 RepID=UPI0020B39C5D|nr:sperm flagellar protein 2 isoform X2 [Brienomyrus brachyistius]